MTSRNDHGIAGSGGRNWSIWLLVLALVLSAGMKLAVLDVGAPHTTIDDITAYEAGFSVWFGNAPPQRMYLESWIIGASSLATYVARAVGEGGLSALDANLVSDAYRDFFLQPDPYVRNYRLLMIAFDLLTVLFVFLAARLVLADRWRGWGAAITASLYALSFNTIWCDVVARPDTVTTLFAAAGLYLYLHSRSGESWRDLLLAGICLGTATGMKLHAMFYVVFIILDLWRVHGLRQAWRRILAMGVVSVLLFAVAAGSPLFDPMKYVKLRLLNARDDESPWIQWGEQFLVLLRGAGWLAVPLAVAAVVQWLRKGREALRDPRFSVIFLAVCWLLLFASIRQLRAYWMLPALPAIYLSAVLWLSGLAQRRIATVVAAVLLLLLAGQSVVQMQDFRRVPFGQLRDWITTNVDPAEPFFVFGYEAVELPKNADCLARTVAILERGFDEEVKAGMPFYERHVTQWEERTRVRMIDLLDDPHIEGYTYYGHYRTPLEESAGILALEQMKYLLVQEHFAPGEQPGLAEYLAAHCDKVAELTGPGGGGGGLGYEVYARREATGATP